MPGKRRMISNFTGGKLTSFFAAWPACPKRLRAESLPHFFLACVGGVSANGARRGPPAECRAQKFGDRTVERGRLLDVWVMTATLDDRQPPRR